MADQVQFRGGTEAENDAFTGVNKEITVDTTNNTLRVHDGARQGGFPVLGEAQLKNVDTLAALKALEADAFSQVFMRGRASTGDGAHGVFVWRTGDQSANVTNDPGEVVWVPPDADATGASGAWERLVTGALVVDLAGAVGDGATDDSSAFTNLQAYLDNQNGGLALVPFESAGYVLGDGSANSTAMVPTDKTHWKGDAETKLIHRAKNSAGENFLFYLEDVEDVSVDGFEIDAESQTRVGVVLRGTVDNVVLRNLHIHDCNNVAFQYADTDTSTGTAYINNVRLENIRIDGVVGAAGAGSGINFFPRAGDAFSQGLVLSHVDVDVTEGSTTVSNHGPQACKISNIQNVQMSHCRFRGGTVAALVLTAGVRDVQIESVHTSLASRGITIDGSVSASAPAATHSRRIKVNSFTYRSDGASGGDSIGINIEGDLEGIHFGEFDIEGAFRLRANDNGDELKDCSFGSGIIRGQGFITDPDGNTPTADITGFSFGRLQLLTPSQNTSVEFGDSNWPISNSSVESLFVEEHPVVGMQVEGDDNYFGEVHSHNGNTAASAAGAVVRDEGNRNVYDLIAITGASDANRYFMRKLGGDGVTIRGVRGTTVNAQGFDFQNQENSDVPLGDVVVTTEEHDLSGSNQTIPLYVADVDTYILGVKFFYPEASSADAGVDQELRVDKSTILTYTSESSVGQFGSTNYINTSGTRSFSNRKIAKGSYLDILMRGGKTGGGTLIAQVSMVRARS